MKITPTKAIGNPIPGKGALPLEARLPDIVFGTIPESELWALHFLSRHKLSLPVKGGSRQGCHIKGPVRRWRLVLPCGFA